MKDNFKFCTQTRSRKLRRARPVLWVPRSRGPWNIRVPRNTYIYIHTHTAIRTHIQYFAQSRCAVDRRVDKHDTTSAALVLVVLTSSTKKYRNYTRTFRASFLDPHLLGERIAYLELCIEALRCDKLCLGCSFRVPYIKLDKNRAKMERILRYYLAIYLRINKYRYIKIYILSKNVIFPCRPDRVNCKILSHNGKTRKDKLFYYFLLKYQIRRGMKKPCLQQLKRFLIRLQEA